MLRNNFEKKGVEFEEFKDLVSEFSEITHQKEVLGKDLTFLSLCTIPERQVAGKAMFYVFNEETLEAFSEGKKLQVGALDRDSIGEELLQELEDTTGLMIIHRPTDEKFIVSDLAIPTITIRAEVRGDATISRQNIVRNMHFADALIARNKRISLIYREYDGVKKIFAAMGTDYKLVRQDVLTSMTDVIMKEEVLGKGVVKNWSLDHSFTEINIIFPEKADEFASTYGVKDVTPGIQLMTSDIGKSSIIARGVFYCKNGSYVVTDEVQAMHLSTIKTDSLIGMVYDNVFDKIRIFPELMAKLIGKNIIDYTEIDLSTDAGQTKNADAVKVFYEKSIRTVFKKVLPVKRQKELISSINAEFNPCIPYTLFDIAMTFMELPDRIKGIDYVSLLECRRVCAKAPQIIEKLSKHDDPMLYLSA